MPRSMPRWLGLSVCLVSLSAQGQTVLSGDRISGPQLEIESAELSGVTRVSGVLDIGLEIVSDSRTADGGDISVGVVCPGNKKVLGGGCSHGGNSSGTLQLSHPSLDDGWRCRWIDTEDGHHATVYAICASVQ